MNSFTTTRTIKTVVQKMPAIGTLLILSLFLLLNTFKVNGQNSDVWAGDPAMHLMSNSDAGGNAAIADYPLLEVNLPNTYELNLTPDKKYYILTKVNGNREISIIENEQNLSMKYHTANEILVGDIYDITVDTNTYLRNYNEIAGVFPADIFEKMIPVIKDQIYPLFAGMHDYKIATRCAFTRIRSTKIVTEDYVIKMKFDKKGNLVRMAKKVRTKHGNEQAQYIHNDKDILYAQKLNQKKDILKKPIPCISVLDHIVSLASNKETIVQFK
jgi:hypothetical protein